LSASKSSLAHIALPYASALYELAQDNKAIVKVEKSLDAITKLNQQNKDFSILLSSPVISADEKSKAIEAILKKSKTLPLVANFIRLVANNSRLFALPAIISTYKEIAAKGRKEVFAEVTSAKALSASQLKSLAATLKKEIGKTVKLETHVDADLIGGLIVKVGSKMIDSSLQTKLNAMKNAMKEVG